MAQAKVRKEGGGMALIWLQGLACGGLAAIEPAGMAQIGLLLAPGLAALLLDASPGKAVARSMLLFGLALSVDPIRMAWVNGTGPGFAAITDLSAILPAWVAAAGGWLLSQVLPVMIGMVVNTAQQARADQLHAMRAELDRTWGLEPRDDAPTPGSEAGA